MHLQEILTQHGYLVCAAVLFLGAAGLPLPCGIVLLLGGAAAGHHALNPFALYAATAAGAIAGDTLLYLGGRYTGWWLLGLLCRLSLNPETCIFRSANYFYRSGERPLYFSKFIPGLGDIAAPLVGSLRMRFPRFLRADATGALLYCGAWLTAGYLLTRYITAVEHWVEAAGHIFSTLLLVAVIGYAVVVLVSMLKSRRYRKIARVSAQELNERLQNKDDNRRIVIADVRSHGYYDAGTQRIKNSIRLEPSRINAELDAMRNSLEPECEVYLYCSCIRESTSARIAHELIQRGNNVKVIEGGMRAWTKAGCPVEPVPAEDVAHLPRFD